MTQMAYNSLICGYEATDVLMSELGAACSEYETEDEYLAGIFEYVKEIEENSGITWMNGICWKKLT